MGKREGAVHIQHGPLLQHDEEELSSCCLSGSHQLLRKKKKKMKRADNSNKHKMHKTSRVITQTAKTNLKKIGHTHIYKVPRLHLTPDTIQRDTTLQPSISNSSGRGESTTAKEEIFVRILISLYSSSGLT